MDHQFDESYPFVYIGHVWLLANEKTDGDYNV